MDGEQGDLTPQKVGYLYEEQYANECKSVFPILQFLFVFRREGELRGNYRTSGGLEKEESGRQCLLHAKYDPLYI